MKIDSFLREHTTEAENQRLAQAMEAHRLAELHVSLTLACILQAHWPEACELKCACGRPICYVAYYWHMKLLCSQCYADQLPDGAKRKGPNEKRPARE